MKITLAIIFCLCILYSCNTNTPSFNSDKLRGKYEVEIIPNTKTAKEAVTDNEIGMIGLGIASMALSGIDLEISFYENSKGVFHINGGLVNFLNVFLDKDIKTKEFEYKIENDSILYLKGEVNESNDFQQWAIIRKYSDTYDYIQLIVMEQDKESVIYNLNKKVEK